MSKTLEEAEKIYLQIHKDEFKELGLKNKMTTIEAVGIIRNKLGLKPRARTRSANSIYGVMRNKEYNEEEKAKIVEFMKGLGTDKEVEETKD